MSQEIIDKICSLLEQLINNTGGFNWDAVSAIGDWVTPIVGTIISYYLGKKIEKEKHTVSNANSATLDIVKSQGNLPKEISENDIYNYIEACITTSTGKIEEFFNMDTQEVLNILTQLENNKRVKSTKFGEDKSQWMWQTR